MKEFIDVLNSYSGLFALLAVIVPIIIYVVERLNRRKELRDELDAMHEWDGFPMSMEERKNTARESWLEKQVGKRKKNNFR